MYGIHHLKVYRLVPSSTFALLCSHPTKQCQNISLIPRRDLLSISTPPIPFPLLGPGNH